MRVEGVKYETRFHIEALKAKFWVSRLTFSILV